MRRVKDKSDELYLPNCGRIIPSWMLNVRLGEVCEELGKVAEIEGNPPLLYSFVLCTNGYKNTFCIYGPLKRCKL